MINIKRNKAQFRGDTKFNNFQVSKEELKGILDMYVETLNMSKERTD